jgi:hypothetical protein
VKELMLQRLGTAFCRWALWFLGVGLLVTVRVRYAGHLLFGGGVLFDSEGFSRMCRVSRLFGTDAWILGANLHEGWPTGAATGYSTLSDYLLLWMGGAVRSAGWVVERWDDRLGVILQSGAMDYGGGLFGVCAGLAVAAALWWRLRAQGWGRWTVVIWGMMVCMPPMIFATRFGALDESVLALAFLGWVLVIEDSDGCSETWLSVVSGLLGGMAMWTAPRFSWPVIFGVVMGRCLKTSSFKAVREVLRWIIPLLGVLALAISLDGRAWLGSLIADGAERWHSSQSLWRPVEDSLAPVLWFGGAMAIPVLALFHRSEDWVHRRWRRLVACSGILAAGASWWMPVWAPLAVILMALSADPARQSVRWVLSASRLGRSQVRLALIFVALGSFWPVARWWEGWIFPAESRVAEAMEYREEMGQLRRIATGIRGGGIQPFLAPWYLSSAVSYWSMQPSVARFTWLEGVETDFATAFFASSDVRSQREPVVSLGVRWIICDAPDRFERNAVRMGYKKDSKDEAAIRTLRKGRQITEPLGFTRVFTTGTFVVLEPTVADGGSPR